MYGILRSGTWGLIQTKPSAPSWLGLSPVIWLVLAGGAVLLGFLAWERRSRDRGKPVLMDPAIAAEPGAPRRAHVVLLPVPPAGGPVLLGAAVPVGRARAVGGRETGVRLLPLSVTLLARRGRDPEAASRMCHLGGSYGSASWRCSWASWCWSPPSSFGAGPEIVTWPMLLAGLGVGALASQLGSVTVSAVPDAQTAEVGGLQNTVTNLGASIGTALAGAVLISALTDVVLHGNSGQPRDSRGGVLEGSGRTGRGHPVHRRCRPGARSDAAGVPGATAEAIVEENAQARLDGLRAALSVLALFALAALPISRSIPTRQPGAPSATPDPS